MLKQKFYLLPENLCQLNNLNMVLEPALMFLIGIYLFQLIVAFNPYFNCHINFALSWVDKVTTGT